MNKEASYYKRLENGNVECLLCPHKCKISIGSSGSCRVRSNRSSILETSNYNKISSMGFDPIEKKPLYHYKPGTYILSVGSYGCNFSCEFCQNHNISKGSPDTIHMTSDMLIEKALELRTEGNIGIAFTYNEPTIWYEFVRECAEAAKDAGLDTVLVSNGYMNEEPFKELSPFIDAVNIDLKSFTNEFYRKICSGDVESVKNMIRLASNSCHVEIATLLIGGYNDSIEELEGLSQWIGSINPSIPLHLSRYHPAYKFTEPATPIENMMKGLEIAKQNLHHVYLGNVWERDSNTLCPQCGEKLICRNGFDVKVFMKTNQCPKCGEKIYMII